MGKKTGKNIPLTEQEREFVHDFYVEFIKLIDWMVCKYEQDPSAREDLVQEILLQMILNVHTLQQLSKQQIISYLHITARRACWRSQNPPETAVDFLDQIETASPADALEDRTALQLEMRQAILALSKKERELLIEKYVLGYSSQELAQRHQSTPGSIRALLSRVRKKMQEPLESYIRQETAGEK